MSLNIDSKDSTGVETRVRKGEFRFFLNRPGDGKYVFKEQSVAARDEWIAQIQRIIDVRSVCVCVCACGVCGIY